MSPFPYTSDAATGNLLSPWEKRIFGLERFCSVLERLSSSATGRCLPAERNCLPSAPVAFGTTRRIVSMAKLTLGQTGTPASKVSSKGTCERSYACSAEGVAFATVEETLTTRSCSHIFQGWSCLHAPYFWLSLCNLAVRCPAIRRRIGRDVIPICHRP